MRILKNIFAIGSHVQKSKFYYSVCLLHRPWRLLGGEGADKVTKHELWLLALVLSLTFLIRLPMFSEPIGTDQAVHAILAEGLLRGKMLYRDLFDHRFPGMPLLYTAAFALLGPSTFAIYVLDLTFTLMTALLLWLLGRKLYSPAAGLLATLLYVVFSNGVSFNYELQATFFFRAQPEVLMGPSVIGALYAFLRAREEAEGVAGGEWASTWRLGVAGLLLGTAVAIKPTTGLLLPLFFLALLKPNAVGEPRYWWRYGREVSWLLGGFIASGLPWLVYFAAAGTLPFLIEATVFFNAVYTRVSYDPSAQIENTMRIVREEFSMWLIAGLTGLGLLLRCFGWRNLLVVGWMALMLAGVVVQRKFYSYQFLCLVPPLALLTAAGTTMLLEKACLTLARAIGYAAVSLLVLNIILFAWINGGYYATWLHWALGRDPAYMARFTTYPLHYSYRGDEALASYIATHTSATDRIASLGGYGATPQFLSGRDNSSRFFYNYFMFNRSIADYPLIVRLRSEWLATIQQRPPRYLLTFAPLENFEHFYELYGWITTHYQLEQRFADDRFLYAYTGSR